MDNIDCLVKISELIPVTHPQFRELAEFIGKATAAKSLKDAIEGSTDAMEFFKQAVAAAGWNADDLVKEVDGIIGSKRQN